MEENLIKGSDDPSRNSSLLIFFAHLLNILITPSLSDFLNEQG